MPPRPTSTTATSTGASANAANAIAVTTSNLLIAGPPAAVGLLVDQLDEGLDLAVGVDVAARADGPAVDADPLDRRLQVRAGGAAGAPVQRGEQRVDHPRHRRLAVGAGDVDRRVAALRRAEQVHQRRDAGERRLDLGFRPTLVEFRCSTSVSSASRPATGLVRHRTPAARLGSVIAIAARPACAVMPLDLLAGQLLAGADLVDDLVGRLGQERLVGRACRSVPASSFSAAARSFSSRRRSAATSTVPEVSSSTATVPRASRTSTDAVGGEAVAGAVSHASDGTAGC